MPKYKIEATMIIRPYLTIEASCKEEAIAKLHEEQFDKKELIETAFPISNIEVDGIDETDKMKSELTQGIIQ